MCCLGFHLCLVANLHLSEYTHTCTHTHTHTRIHTYTTHTEHNKNRQVDGWRFQQVCRSTSRPHHAHRKFGTGDWAQQQDDTYSCSINGFLLRCISILGELIRLHPQLCVVRVLLPPSLPPSYPPPSSLISPLSSSPPSLAFFLPPHRAKHFVRCFFTATFFPSLFVVRTHFPWKDAPSGG